MKFAFLFTLVCLCLASTSTYGQKRVTLRGEDMPVEAACDSIERQTGYVFSYAPGVLADFPALTLQLEDLPVEEVLRVLFDGTSVSWKWLGHFIILKRRLRYFSVSGHARDAATGESLPGTSVYARGLATGTVADDHGHYALLLPEGVVELTYSFVGYESLKRVVRLAKDTMIHVYLRGGVTREEVTVKEEQTREWVRNLRAGQVELPVATVDALPKMLGEGDVLKAVQLLPGVRAGVEGAAGTYVRGGERDENLLLLEDIPLYNADHLLGLFSAFNPDAVQAVDFYKAGFPPRYGGRLSSVTDVRLKEGDREEYHGTVSVGLLASRLHFTGPIERGRSAFQLSLRRTYTDLILAPIYAASNKSDEYEERVGYYFADALLKCSRRFGEGGTLSFLLFWGDDVLKYRRKEWSGSSFDPDVKRERLRGAWGNLACGLRWEKPTGQRWHFTALASYNRFRSRADRDNYLYLAYPGEEQRRGLDFRSSQAEYTLRGDLDAPLNHRNHLRLGGYYTFHRFVPERRRERRVQDDDEQRYHLTSANNAHELTLYAEDELTLSPRLRLFPGFRATLFQVDGRAYLSCEPRLSLQHRWSEGWSLRASCTRVSQYVHQLRSSLFSLPTDIWAPVTRQVKPMHSWQFSAGVGYIPVPRWRLSLDLFYKRTTNLLSEFNGWQLTPDYRQWVTYAHRGRGRACGLEAMLQATTRRTSGWLNYTLSRSERCFPGTSINDGRPFPAKFDARHVLNIVLRHRFSTRFDVGALWTYNSGFRATVPLVRYDMPSLLPGGDAVDSHEPVWQVTSPNNMTTPDYHRLDLSMNFHRQRRHGVSTWSIHVYNLYSRLNAVGIDYDVIASSSPGSPDKLYFTRDWLLPILPSVSYTFTF